nr:unnamed protein product [Digitaria exilis]
MKSLIEGFRGNKSSVVSVMDDEPILVDFLSMTLVNLKTRKQRSVAWFDDTGKRFFPSLFFDEESDEMTKGDSGNADSTAQGIMVDKVANSPPEVVKQVVLESSPPVPEKPSTVGVLRKKISSVERGSESFLFVQDLFLSGMGPFATPSNILHIHRYSPNDITAQCRFEAFERQMKSTKEARGDANVSVGLCDVDEKGVQYMLLCRMILGNMEAVEPGSQESFPSSEIYDSGSNIPLIQPDNLSAAKELLFHHYEELKENIISREEMVKNMIIIVGEKILLEALKKLHYCPSLWYKPSVEAVSSDTVMAAPEQLSLDKAGRGKSSSMSAEGRDSLALSITPKGNCGPALSKAPKPHESPIANMSTKGHGSLAPGITPKGNSVPASSKVPKRDESTIPDMSPKGHDSLALSITRKAHEGGASSKKPKQVVDTLPESGHSQAQDVAAKVYRVSKPITGEPNKEQAAVPASQAKPSGRSLDASSHVTGAANALVALSTLREKGGH